MSPLSPVSPLSPPDQQQSQLDLSPPLGTFKRQKCLRFKNRSGRQSAVSNPSPSSGGRCGPGGPGSSASAGAAGGGGQLDDDRRPILRSKSDISDRYWNRSQPERSLPVTADVREHRERRVDRERERDRDRDREQLVEKPRSRSDSLTQLERFFDRLGLDEETYDRYIAPKNSLQRRSSGSYHHHSHHSNSASSDIHRLSDDCSAGGGSGGGGGADSDESSAVFFSDVSTIDSTKLPDSTETANGQGQGVQGVASGPQLMGGPGPIVGPTTVGPGALMSAGDGAPLLGGGPAPLYRTSEPPSIIERNARIIKWLCNCKKMQLA
uniref:Centrosome-associated FAM110 C-terminal domain-containing protein n=1 Tax=Anopheles culicifacies TaxID=139723 RepID=A0A182MKE6_9DIPT